MKEAETVTTKHSARLAVPAQGSALLIYMIGKSYIAIRKA
jgi:hypothetical protein